MRRVCRFVCLAMGTVVIGACASTPVALTNAVAVPAPVEANTPFATADPEAPLLDRRVFVEGDSLTAGVSGFLPPMLAAAGWTATLDDQIGRATATGISNLSRRASEIGGTLVVALGTNDWPDPSEFSSRVDQVMIIASGRRVIWVTVARAGFDGLNRALIAAQARWSNLRVIDWRPVIAAYPTLQAADGIHLTMAGYQLRAQFIASAVETIS